MCQYQLLELSCSPQELCSPETVQAFFNVKVLGRQINRFMSLSFLACLHAGWAVGTAIHLGGPILFQMKLVTGLLSSHSAKRAISKITHFNHELSSYKVFQKAVNKA